MSDDPKQNAKVARKAPGVEASLRQFLNHDGPKGTSPAFQRGHEFAFVFTQDQKDRVNKLMDYGMPFDDAFDQVVREDKLDELVKLTEEFGGYADD